jgi:hypothetical protein
MIRAVCPLRTAAAGAADLARKKSRPRPGVHPAPTLTPSAPLHLQTHQERP